MRRALALAAALLALSPLAGCGKRREGASSAPGGSAPSAAPSPKAGASFSSGEGEAPSGPDAVAERAGAATYWAVSGVADMGASAPRGAGELPLLLEGRKAGYVLHFPAPVEINFLEIVPRAGQAPALDVTIEAGDALVYGRAAGEDEAPPGATDSLVCRFDAVRAQSIRVYLRPIAGREGDKNPVGALRPGYLEPGTRAAAYLPAAFPPQSLAEYMPSLERAGRVTVISGLQWGAGGEILETDENYSALIKELCRLREGCGFEIYATVFPQGGLVRAGTAYKTVATPEARGALVEALLEHAGAYGLDGIDFDWESQQSGEEWDAYAALLREAGAAFEGAGLGLSAAVYPGDAARLCAASGAIGTLNLMAYDQFTGGLHATFATARQALEQALAAGFAPGQVSLGIPAYGRPLDGGASWPLYNEQGLGKNENLMGDAYFNGAQLARDKGALARLLGLEGVFIYHLAGDFPADRPGSLLGSVD